MENLELTKKLNEIFKEFDTKPVLFFGSGMSKRYYDLPNWENLLKYFSQIIDPNNTFAFQYLFKAPLLQMNGNCALIYCA